MTNKFEVRHSIKDQNRDIPFDGDAIGVRQLSTNLEEMFMNLNGLPFVVGINSRWGTGKTWFLTEWAKQLEGNNWTTISFSAWENDFLSDPMLCLLSELSEKFQGDEAKLLSFQGMKSAAGFLLKNVAPAVLKSATMGVLDLDEGLEAILGSGVEKAAEKAIQNQLNLKKQLNQFIEHLGDLAQNVVKETGHPLVIIVDELDRCRPAFALEMLEVIKHLFEVSNVVFVLGFDGEQLACSTKAVYGSEFDGTGYLRRFINLQVSLPSDSDGRFFDRQWRLMGFEAWGERRNGYTSNFGTLEDAKDTFKELIDIHQISLRGQQKILTQFSAINLLVGEQRFLFPRLISSLVVLSILDLSLMKRFLDNEASPHAVFKRLWPSLPIGPGSKVESDRDRIAAYSVLYLFILDDCDFQTRMPKLPKGFEGLSVNHPAVWAFTKKIIQSMNSDFSQMKKDLIRKYLTLSSPIVAKNLKKNKI